MEHDEATLAKVARDTIDRLTTLRDEVRVRLHLAGMEAKDFWRRAEPVVQRVETRLASALDGVVEGGSEQVRLELHLGLAEARDRIHELEPKTRALGEAMSEKGRAALAKAKHELARIGPPFD